VRRAVLLVRRYGLRALVAALLGAGAAVLIACGSSAGGLIPASQGGPLQSDIEKVERAAEAGNGNCSATESALLKTDQDYGALPSSVNAELRKQIGTAIENLHKVAKEACEQPLAQTNTVTTPKTTSTPTTTSTQTTPTTTTPPTTTTQTTPPPEKEEESSPGAGGGTPAPGEGNGRPPGEGAGGAAPEAGGGNGAGGSEGGK
jgi:hypothetical protein